MKNPYQDKRSGKLLRVCKLLLTLYQEFQSHSKTSQWTQGKKGMEIGWWTSKSIQRTQGQDYKPTCTCSSEEKRKIQSGKWCFRTHNWRSFISGTRREMETHHFFIKNNAASWKELWDIQQRIVYNNGSSCKIKIIFTEYHREIWSLDRSQESQIFLRTTQTQ